MITASAMSPPASPTTSPKTNGISNRSNSPGTPLSLDLSSLPPLVAPSPPSNTLLITNLNNPSTFHPQSLENIKQLLSTPTPLNSFSPLRAFHRIIVSYPTIDAAIQTRQLLDGTNTSSIHSNSNASQHPQAKDSTDSTLQSQQRREDRIRIYFGPPTPVAGLDEEIDRHLKAPSLGKLLFISPPPSPPCGWEIREEEPPNKETHAEDLQKALAGLNTHKISSSSYKAKGTEMGDEGHDDGDDDEDTIAEAADTMETDAFGKATVEGSRVQDLKARRERSSSTTMVYHPRDHGDNEDLPAVVVEDTTPTEVDGEGMDDGEEEVVELGEGRKIMAHTARPPVELMEE